MKIISFVLALLCSITSFAQDTSEYISPERKAKCYPVTFQTVLKPGKVTFGNVFVYDVRPDTTKIGYFTSSVNGNLLKYCIHRNTFREYFESLLKSEKPDTASFDLAIFLTKGWISTHAKNSRIELTAELFIKNEKGFHPLYKFDTVIEREAKGIYTVKWFDTLLRASVSGLASVSYSNKMKKVLTDDQIASRYDRSRFSLKKPANRGVYMNLEELKKDKPSLTDFTVQFNELTDELFVKENEKYNLVRDAWGFCDGKDVFIRIGDNYFPVDQSGSIPNFFAVTDIKAKQKSPLTLIPSAYPQIVYPALYLLDYAITARSRKLVKMKPCQLNTLTGEIY